jgi:RNA polymerase sigma-70 factor (family 1)
MNNSFSILSDQELFSRIQSGDRDAFDIFYHRHFPDLFKAAFKRLPDAETAKDILQDVFTDLWTRKETINNDNPVAYLHTAVRFQTIKRAARSVNTVFYEPFEEMGKQTIAATEPSVEETIHHKELLRLIDLWVDALPPKRREIFLLYYKENLSTKAISQRLKISQKTVQNQLGISFTFLRDKLPDVAMGLLLCSFIRF